MCKIVLRAYNSAKIIFLKSSEFFQSYDHKGTATYFMNHNVYLPGWELVAIAVLSL